MAKKVLVCISGGRATRKTTLTVAVMQAFIDTLRIDRDSHPNAITKAVEYAKKHNLEIKEVLANPPPEAAFTDEERTMIYLSLIKQAEDNFIGHTSRVVFVEANWGWGAQQPFFNDLINNKDRDYEICMVFLDCDPDEEYRRVCARNALRDQDVIPDYEKLFKPDYDKRLEIDARARLAIQDRIRVLPTLDTTNLSSDYQLMLVDQITNFVREVQGKPKLLASPTVSAKIEKRARFIDGSAAAATTTSETHTEAKQPMDFMFTAGRRNGRKRGLSGSGDMLLPKEDDDQRKTKRARRASSVQSMPYEVGRSDVFSPYPLVKRTPPLQPQSVYGVDGSTGDFDMPMFSKDGTTTSDTTTEHEGSPKADAHLSPLIDRAPSRTDSAALLSWLNQEEGLLDFSAQLSTSVLDVPTRGSGSVALSRRPSSEFLFGLALHTTASSSSAFQAQRTGLVVDPISTDAIAQTLRQRDSSPRCRVETSTNEEEAVLPEPSSPRDRSKSLSGY